MVNKAEYLALARERDNAIEERDAALVANSDLLNRNARLQHDSDLLRRNLELIRTRYNELSRVYDAENSARREAHIAYTNAEERATNERRNFETVRSEALAEIDRLSRELEPYKRAEREKAQRKAAKEKARFMKEREGSLARKEERRNAVIVGLRRAVNDGGEAGVKAARILMDMNAI